MCSLVKKYLQDTHTPKSGKALPTGLAKWGGSIGDSLEVSSAVGENIFKASLQQWNPKQWPQEEVTDNTETKLVPSHG